MVILSGHRQLYCVVIDDYRCGHRWYILLRREGWEAPSSNSLKRNACVLCSFFAAAETLIKVSTLYINSNGSFQALLREFSPPKVIPSTLSPCPSFMFVYRNPDLQSLKSFKMDPFPVGLELKLRFSRGRYNRNVQKVYEKPIFADISANIANFAVIRIPLQRA